MILPYLSHYPRHIVYFYLYLVIKKLIDIPAVKRIFSYLYY
nr:MAG TPA: hypothetical protein [Caudoviricetes sp.]